MSDCDVCKEHSGIVSYLQLGGGLFGLFLLVLIGIATFGYVDLQDYKIKHEEIRTEIQDKLNVISTNVQITANNVAHTKDDIIEIKQMLNNRPVLADLRQHNDHENF